MVAGVRPNVGFLVAPRDTFIVAKPYALFRRRRDQDHSSLYSQSWNTATILRRHSATFDTVIMAAKTLEARFEHLSVNDENEAPNGTTMLKSKVFIHSHRAGASLIL